MQVKSQQDLIKFLQRLNQPIAKALNDNVAKTVKQVMKEKVKEEVYDVYTPDPNSAYSYKRTGLLGSEESMKSELINDTTLVVENIRSDGDRNVAEIVESGIGYEYSFDYAGVPRPFTEATREELRATGAHKAALYQGLKQQGIEVKLK
ncbi:hypothetical protein [Paenibacillus illinoisensis]|uniref:Phage protein n=1 Tax=Paenibacillus illinoisensis TaxID=59845 RepID=A0A2W0C8M7_9BACL|nr:hypothetical protein [Paenibacillus illinoisensis]PYY28364.1 Uncharacterized protein PIL02S_03515 [Paenibacillus illinoisensis]